MWTTVFTTTHNTKIEIGFDTKFNRFFKENEKLNDSSRC